MDITFNGEAKKVRSFNLKELLEEFEIANQKIAVELNRKIVPRSDYENTNLHQGDRIEVVQFVGGG